MIRLKTLTILQTKYINNTEKISLDGQLSAKGLGGVGFLWVF